MYSCQHGRDAFLTQPLGDPSQSQTPFLWVGRETLPEAPRRSGAVGRPGPERLEALGRQHSEWRWNRPHQGAEGLS